MDGAKVVEVIYDAIKDCGFPGWMDKKPINEDPDLFFVVAHISTTHSQMINKVPVNISVFTKKTAVGVPKRDLLVSSMEAIESLLDGIELNGVYFSAEKSLTSFFFEEKEYDIISCRFNVIVSR